VAAASGAAARTAWCADEPLGSQVGVDIMSRRQRPWMLRWQSHLRGGRGTAAGNIGVADLLIRRPMKRRSSITAKSRPERPHA